MNLGNCPIGAALNVTELTGLDALEVRIRELGIRPGQQVQVLKRVLFGRCIVAVAQQRIVLAPKLAACIAVHEMGESK